MSVVVFKMMHSVCVCVWGVGCGLREELMKDLSSPP